MPRTHEANTKPRTHETKKSIALAQILDPYEVTLDNFFQTNDVSFAHVFKA